MRRWRRAGNWKTGTMDHRGAPRRGREHQMEGVTPANPLLMPGFSISRFSFPPFPSIRPIPQVSAVSERCVLVRVEEKGDRRAGDVKTGTTDRCDTRRDPTEHLMGGIAPSNPGSPRFPIFALLVSLPSSYVRRIQDFAVVSKRIVF